MVFIQSCVSGRKNTTAIDRYLHYYQLNMEDSEAKMQSSFAKMSLEDASAVQSPRDALILEMFSKKKPAKKRAEQRQVDVESSSATPKDLDNVMKLDNTITADPCEITYGAPTLPDGVQLVRPEKNDSVREEALDLESELFYLRGRKGLFEKRLGKLVKEKKSLEEKVAKLESKLLRETYFKFQWRAERKAHQHAKGTIMILQKQLKAEKEKLRKEQEKNEGRKDSMIS